MNQGGDFHEKGTANNQNYCWIFVTQFLGEVYFDIIPSQVTRKKLKKKILF